VPSVQFCISNQYRPRLIVKSEQRLEMSPIRRLNLHEDVSAEDVKQFIAEGGNVTSRVPNPQWIEISSGQYLALNVFVLILFVTIWIFSWLFALGVILITLLVAPTCMVLFELVPRKYLLGYSKLGAAIRVTLLCILIVRSPLWLKITIVSLATLSVIGPIVYHAVHVRWMGEDNTLLHLAIFLNCAPEVVKTLLEAGADVSAKNSDLNTPLHFAYSNLGIAQLLLENGAQVDAENYKQQTPLDWVTKPGIAQALLQAGATANQKWKHVETEMGSFRGGKALVPIGLSRTLKPGHSLCFISHHKTDAASSAVFFHGVLCARFKLKSDQVFLDSNSLEDLRHIINLVKNSKILFLLLTKNVLSRPFCLAEIATAISGQIPIIAVNLEGQGYSFEESRNFLASQSFRTALENRNPGASASLEEQGFNVDDLGQTLSAVLPNIIAKPFNPAASERVRASQIDDIIGGIVEKI
jgi:hypothetical protein